MWDAHLPRLAGAGVRAIALDLPGHGDALVPDRREVAPWPDVLDTLSRLGADRFVLAGNSLGALVALQAAVTASERVEGLVLVGYRPHDQPAARARRRCARSPSPPWSVSANTTCPTSTKAARAWPVTSTRAGGPSSSPASATSRRWNSPRRSAPC
ncbi:alpha/beta fold hydrolase [Streptomyces sp. NPDC059455]|uniref:alpha/beta fold hydrolase n=1 Tax=Streptomyces sp. NPDC059455 TaxID=3346837 RepID=UPI0036B3CFE3